MWKRAIFTSGGLCSICAPTVAMVLQVTWKYNIAPLTGLWASYSQASWWPLLWKTELSHCLCIWIIKDNIGFKGPETISFFPFSPPLERLNINIPSSTTISNRKWLCRLRFGSHLGRTLKEIKPCWYLIDVGWGRNRMKTERNQTFSSCKEYLY